MEFDSRHKEVHKIQLSIELTKCQIYCAMKNCDNKINFLILYVGLLTYNIINAWLLLHFRFNLFKVLVINYLIYCHKCLNESPFCVLALT